MECPECGAEMDHVSEYGYLAAHQSGEVLGQIYQCPNSEEFEDPDEACHYTMKLGTVEALGIGACMSGAHSGHFYTDKQGDLHTGHPC